jgi:hypothetical protein
LAGWRSGFAIGCCCDTFVISREIAGTSLGFTEKLRAFYIRRARPEPSNSSWLKEIHTAWSFAAGLSKSKARLIPFRF